MTPTAFCGGFLMMVGTEMDACVACGGSLKFFGPRDGYRYYRCEACRSLQLSPIPTEKEVRDRYETQYVAGDSINNAFSPEWWGGASVSYRRSILKVLQEHKVSGRVVDYGTGWGHSVAFYREHGFDATGIEFSRREVTWSQERGVPVEQGGIEKLAEHVGSLGGVTMQAVFEHMTDFDLFLRTVHRALVSDGYFVTLHPTSEFFALVGDVARGFRSNAELPDLLGGFSPPWHTALLSIKGSEALISRYGFQLVDVRPAPQGRLGGALGAIQASLEAVNKIGWSIFGQRWPLVTSHIFTFRKT